MRLKRIFLGLLGIVIGLVFLSVVLVTILRWVNPPITAFMMETRAQLSDQVGHPVKLRRDWVAMSHISPAMALAAVASEDQNFPSNHGFDVGAIKKAIHYNAHHQNEHGASTIRQQTAKNLFLWPVKTYVRKAVGAYFTVLEELLWPKKRILEVYLNVAQFGAHIFGVKAAAAHFFGEAPDSLTAAQAALLIAALPAPDRYSISDPHGYMRERQRWILDQMHNLGAGYLAACRTKHRAGTVGERD
jgi:monofunctional biosynthetic peptidoglycan transglycosylase